MGTAVSPTKGGRKKEDDKKKKLTKVLSTKLSNEDYKVFRILTNYAYRWGRITHDSPSEMLRYIITPVIDDFRKVPGFSFLKQNHE
jgi:hypothetical protein